MRPSPVFTTRRELEPRRYVLTLPQPVNREVQERIQEIWKTFAGPDTKLLILDAGTTIRALEGPEPGLLRRIFRRLF